MSIFAGIYSLNREIIPNWVKSIEQNLSRSNDLPKEYSWSGFTIFKIDFGAWPADSGEFFEEDKGVTCVAGEPLLHHKNGIKTRFNDVVTIFGELSRPHLEALGKCRGSYALAHYNAISHQLVLATDKIGVRPLYYVLKNDVVAFSTCLRALRSLDFISSEIDLLGVSQQLSFGVSLGNRTVLKDIKVLRGGEYLRIGGDIKSASVQAYFRWDKLGRMDSNSHDIYKVAFDTLKESTSIRARREDRAFALLSGGLDSRCIVSLLIDLGKTVTAFNFAREREQDLVFAKAFADQVGLRLNTIKRPNSIFMLGKLIADAISTVIPERSKTPATNFARLVFSGDGGSVSVGRVYIDQGLISCLTRKQLPEVAKYLLSSRLPSKKLFKSEAWHAIYKDLEESVINELESIELDDPEQKAFLFFLRNDQARHLYGFYEDIDINRIELLSPFYDSEFLKIMVQAPPRPFLYHHFYHNWIEHFPPGTASVPWQTYPGHELCPIHIDNSTPSQWEIKPSLPMSSRLKESFEIISLIWQKRMPARLIRAPVALIACVLYAIGLQNYSHVLKAVRSYAA